MARMASFAAITVGSMIANNLNVQSSATNAGMAAGIQSGSSTLGTGLGFANEIAGFADTVENFGGRLGSVGSKLLRFGSALTTGVTIVGAVVDAFNSYQNAVEQFYIDLAKKRLDASLSGFQEELDRVTNNVKNLPFDALNAKIESAGERYVQLLDRLGSQTTASWSNLLDRLGNALGITNIDPRTLSKESRIRELGGDAAARRASLGPGALAIEYEAIIPQLAQEQAALGKAQAEAALGLLRSRLQRGESAEDIIDSSQFESMSNILANSNQALREQLLRIENSGKDDATVASLKKELIEKYGKERIILEANIAAREKDSKSMSVLTNVYTRSLSRMFENMSQAINSTNFALQALTDNADLTAKALSGQAQAGDINLRMLDILKNPRGYSSVEQDAARTGAAGFFGTRADVMPGLLGGSEAAQATIMSTINGVLQDNAAATNEVIAAKIDSNLQQVFRDLGLPPELADKLAREVGNSVADLRKNQDDVLDFGLLSEKIGVLGKTMETFEGAQNSAIQAMQAYQNVLSIYTKQTNELIDLAVSQRQREREASDILTSAYVNLQKTLGYSIDLEESRNRLATRVQGFTGQQETDPGAIFTRFLRLNREREISQSARQTAGERNLAGIDDFTKFNKDLEQSSIALRENYSALKLLAENTEYAADAMSKIQDAQQKIGGRVSFIEKIVTSTPEELDSLSGSISRLQRNMNGQLNTIQNSSGAQKAYNEAIQNGATAMEAMKAAQTAFANERRDTLGALNDLLPFLGSGKETNNIRANVLESMLRESNIGVNPMFAQVLNSLRNPEADPELAAAIEHYNEANNLQAEANRYLAKIENELAKDTAQAQAKALVEGLKSVTLRFENQELKDLNAKINMLIPIGQPQAKAEGGIIYASAGQMVNFQSRGTDTVPAMLTPGEFVVNRSATQKHLPLLQSINSNKYSKGGSVRYYADGGYVHNLISDKNKIKQADQISDKPIIDFTNTGHKNLFDTYAGKQFYSIPAQFTFINPDKQLPTPDDVSLGTDMKNLIPSNGTVVPGVGPSYFLNSNMGGTPSFGYRTEKQIDSKNIVSRNEIIPPDIDNPVHLRQTDFEAWKKASGSRLKLKRKPLLPDLMADYPDLNAFGPLFKKDEFTSTITDPNSILGITDTDATGNLKAEPEKSYRIWTMQDSNYGGIDRAHAISQREPSFNVGDYAGKSFENTIPGVTFLRQPSAADIQSDAYKQLIDKIDDRYKLYQDTIDFANKPSYKTGDMPPGAAMLMQKLANVYSETKSFETFGNADKIDLKTYFDDLISLAPGRKPESLMVFKPNDKALTEAVKLYENRPDLAKDIFIGWSSAPATAKEYSTNTELGIMGWGNMAHLRKKNFPWILNGNLDDLPEETIEEMKANVEANNPGDIKVRLKTTNGKMPIPGIGNILPQFANEKIDFTYAYDEWIGKLYDPKTRTFEPNVVPKPLLLPQNIKGSIFEESNLDINKYRFMGSDQFSIQQIVPDPGKAQDLMDYYSAIINKDDAEKQRILPNVKGAFKYQWNDRRWIGASFGAIPALNKDLDDAKANPVDITTFMLKQAENLLTSLGAKAGQADTGFAALRGSSISDNELPSVVRNLSKGALRLFGSRNIPGFAKNWLYSYIGRVPFMQNMNPAFAKNVSQNISGVLDQAGGSVDKILSNGNWNPRVYDYLQETWTLLAGASKAFAGLGSGNTRFISQIRDLGQDTGIMDLFRSMGGSLSIGKLMGLSLNQNWENLVDGALKDSKIKQIGAGGTLTDLKELPTDVKGLINLIFNPYNEFASVSTRSNLIDNFVTDLFNYRGNNPMMGRNVGANPVIDRNTMDWIKERTDALKVWYAGDGNQWIGQDYLYDKNLEADDSIRIKGFSNSLVNAGLQYYDMANRAHIELGLGEKFGPLPGENWFAARSAQGFQTGGVVYADKGGHMVNFQPRGTDTVPAMLTPGEFVINRAATQKHLTLLTAINDGVQPYNVGGVVYAQNGGKPSLRRELPSTKPRPQVIDPKDIPDVEIPEPVVKTPEQPKRGSGGRKYGSLDMGFGSGSIEYDGNNQQKPGRSKSPRNYGPIDMMQGLEIDNELPSVDGRNNNKKGKKGTPPPVIRKHISPTAKSLGGVVYAQEGARIPNRGVSPRGNIATSMHKQRQQQIDEFNELMLATQAAQSELGTLLFGPSDETKYLLKNTIFDNDQNMLGLYASAGKLRQNNASSDVLEYLSDQIDVAHQGFQEIAEINKVLRLVAGRDKKYGTFDDNDSGLTELSMALSAMSIGTPVVADLANIPVDLLRGDVDSAMMSAASAGLDIFGGYGGAGIAAAKTAKMTAGLGLFGTILGKSKLLTRDTVENTLKNSWKGKIGAEVIDDFYKSIGKAGAADKVKEAYEKALEAFYASTTSAKSPEAIFEAVDIFNRTALPGSGRMIGSTKTADISAVTAGQLAGMLKNRSGIGGIVRYGAERLANLRKLLTWKRLAAGMGGAALGGLGLATLRNTRVQGLIRERGTYGGVNPLYEMDLAGPPLPGQENTDEQNKRTQEIIDEAERQKLDPRNIRIDKKLNRLTKKNADGIPLLVEDAYSMVRDDQGTFLMRLFNSNTWRKLKNEERNRILSDPKLEDLKGNLNDEKTVKHVLDYLSDDFNGYDPEEMKKKFLDDDSYYNRGGMVYANNGMLIPYQPRGTDTVPAMLTPGEFVINRAATQKHLPLLKAINNGSQAYAKGGVVYAAEGGEFPKNRVLQLEKDAEDRIRGGLAADEARRQKTEDAIEQRNRERDAVAYKPRNDLRNSKPLDQDLYDFDNANSWRIYTDDAFVNRGLHPGSFWGAALTPEDLVASAPSYEQRRLKTLIRAGKLADKQGVITKDKEDQNARQQILDQIYQNRDENTSRLERISTGKDIGAVDETDPQKLYQRYKQTALDRFLQWYFYKSKANAGESQRDFLKRTRSGWDSDFNFDNPYNFNDVVTRSKGESEERFVEELIKQGLNAVEAFEKYPALPKKFLSTLEFATINNLSVSQRESLFSMEDQMDPGMEALNIAIQQMVDDKNKQFTEAQKAQAKAVANKAAQSRPQSKASVAVDPGMKMFSQIAERRWEDSSGQHSTIGTLQELIGDKVRISKLNGKTTSISVSRLSTADQNYIRELQEVRNWTDDTGKYKTQARVIGVGKQGIMIQKLDGSTKTVPMNRLSKQDQDYLRQQYADVLASKPSKPKTQTKDVGVSSEDIPSQDSEPPVKSSGLPTSSDAWVGDYYGIKGGRPKDNEERYPMRRKYQAIIKQLQQAKRRIFKKEGNEIIPQNLTLPWNEAENKQWGDVFNKIYEFDQDYRTIPDGWLEGLRNEALDKALKLYEAHRVAYSAPARMQKQAEAEIASWSEKQKEHQYKIDKSRTLDPMEEGLVVGVANIFRPFGEVNLVPKSDELTDGRTNQLYLKRIQKEVFDASKFLSSYYGLEDVYEGIASYKEKGLQEWLNRNQARKPSYRQYGGPIYASNGTLVNYQPRGTDTVPAMLTPGEFVVNRQAAQKNLPLLQAINSNNYSRGGVVYMAAAGLVPMTPGELEGEASDPRNRRGQPPLNRQQQKERQQQAREQKQQAEIKRKRFLSVSPMMRMLIQEINNQPALYDDFDNSAIDEQLYSAELVQKIDEKIKDVGDPSPAGTAKKQKIFMDRGISDFNRFNQLMRWHTNSKNALEYKGTKETDFLDPQTGLPRVVGDFIDKYPSQKQLGFRAILSTQKNNSIKEASAIRNGWITLAQRHAKLFNGMSPEQIINGIITTATQPKAFNNGGLVYANNGMLIPYQPRGTDTVPAMLTPGEFVVNREATQQNLGILRAINSGSYQTGGVVKYLSEGTAGGISFERILSSFSSSINSVTSALSGLLTTLQNAPEGVNNGGNASVGGLDGLSQFTAKFDQFITQLSKLKLPPEINITGNHKVEVVVNGAQALEELLSGPLSRLIKLEVSSAFSKLNRDSEGSIPDPN